MYRVAFYWIAFAYILGIAPAVGDSCLCLFKLDIRNLTAILI